ncbi:hypothetical protein [Corynebacterium sp.]|uniref:hypothetical protein n=1 Tax=Corynebacterium sp. TaxID=1720 RepID=UPI0026DBE01D|nr:hypothetical protein [Corynebacterium sp.]MDO5031433.1 hypothetical protein [Corynebacterium sp.]
MSAQILVLVIFLFSGLCVGGAIAAHREGSRFFTIVAGVLAVIGIAAGVAWIFGLWEGRL